MGTEGTGGPRRFKGGQQAGISGSACYSRTSPYAVYLAVVSDETPGERERERFEGTRGEGADRQAGTGLQTGQKKLK